MRIVNITLLSVVVSHSIIASDLGSVMSEIAKTNPNVVQKRKEFNSAYETLNIAKGDFFLPTVDLTSGISKTKTDPDEGDSSKTTNHNIAIEIRENLFNGYATVNNIEAKKASLASAAYSYIQTISEEALTGAKAYIDLIRNFKLLEIEKDNFFRHKKMMKAIGARNNSGIGGLGDLQEITAKTNLAYANYLAQSKNLKASKISMHQVLGRYLNAKNLSDPSVGENLNYSLSGASDFALLHNPSIFIQKYNLIKARYDYQAGKNSFMPKLDLSLEDSYGKYKNDNSGDSSRSDQMRASLDLEWNLYNGSKDIASHRRDKSTIHVENEKLNSTKRSVIGELELSWISYKMLEKEYEYLKNYEINAKAKLETITKEFRLGQKSLLEFLTSQTDYNSARSKLVNTKYDLIYTKLKILKALGVLPEMVNSNLKSEVGITHDGLFDYQNLNHREDTLPVRDEFMQKGGITTEQELRFDPSISSVAPRQSPKALPLSTTTRSPSYSTSSDSMLEEYPEVYMDERPMAVKKKYSTSMVDSSCNTSPYQKGAVYNRYRLLQHTQVYSHPNGTPIDSLSAGMIITGYQESGNWIRVTGIGGSGWRKYCKTGYIHIKNLSRG
jgi:adhesin transport system outer membrane protein